MTTRDPKKLAATSALYARFARSLAASLRRMSGRDHVVALESLSVQPFGELEQVFAAGSLLHVLRAEGLHSPGLLVMPPPLVALLTEAFLGGDPARGTGRGPADGPMTRRLAQRLAVAALQDLDKVSAASTPFALRLTRQETVFALTAIMPATEPAAIAAFRLSLGSRSETMFLVLPEAALKRNESLLAAAELPEQSRGALAALLPGAEVELVACLGSAHVLLRDLLALTAGDVIQLDRPADQPLDLLVEGVPKLKALPGVAGGHRAVRIVKAA